MIAALLQGKDNLIRSNSLVLRRPILSHPAVLVDF